MDTESNLKFLANAIRSRGFRFLAIYFREAILFDVLHRTNTHSRKPKSDQSLEPDGDAADGLLYVASFTSVATRSVTAARRLLGDSRIANSQFLDLGCGKGKTLLVYDCLFGDQPAPPAIGIDYDAELVAIAKENLRRRAVGEERVQVYFDSATNLANHVTARYLIVYLYNSFTGATLQAVLASLAQFPHVLIYVDPQEKQVLGDHGYLVHHTHNGRYRADTWMIGVSSSLRAELPKSA